MHDQTLDLARRTLDALRARKLMVATAESCTGGLIAGALTDIAGASDVFERGFVTYSNDAKQELIGVPAALLDAHGAVSAPVAEAMALGALKNSRAQIALSVTGVAGPDGGTVKKPVGLVYFGLAQIGRPTLLVEKRFTDDHGKELSRAEIRRLAVRAGLQMLLDAAAPHVIA